MSEDVSQYSQPSCRTSSVISIIRTSSITWPCVTRTSRDRRDTATATLPRSNCHSPSVMGSGLKDRQDGRSERLTGRAHVVSRSGGRHLLSRVSNVEKSIDSRVKSCRYVGTRLLDLLSSSKTTLEPRAATAGDFSTNKGENYRNKGILRNKKELGVTVKENAGRG